MKRLFLNIVLLTALCLQMAADEMPAWLTKLENCDIIDSIREVNGGNLADSNVTAYLLYYHQPLCHEQSDGELCPLRCLFFMRNDNDPAICSNVIYFSDYEIDMELKMPGPYFRAKACSEMAHRYHANLLMPEHRYFSYSSPENCWKKLNYLTANEAAQDFHALIETMKTVFKGKWAMTGISKGGIATAIQHAYFPEDADLYVPNSAPFCRTVADKRLHKYFVGNGWEENTRISFNSFTRELLEDSVAVGIFAKRYKLSHPECSDYVCRKLYYAKAMQIGFDTHSYYNRKIIDGILTSNESNRQYILDQHIDSVTSSFLNVLIVENGSLDASEAWNGFLPSQNSAKGSMAGLDEVNITRDQWNSNTSFGYYVQAARELGSYDFDIRYLYSEEAGLSPEQCEKQQHFADSLQEFFEIESPSFFVDFPSLKPIQYDDYALFSMVEQKTKEATKPIIFLYGEDDSWAGAPMGDEFINKGNVRKYILHSQKHGIAISTITTEEKNEIWAFIDKYMIGSSTGINDISSDNMPVLQSSPQKVLRNGRIVITKDGRHYSVSGQEVM